LITNEEEVQKKSQKVKSAIKYGVAIVREEYLQECIKAGYAVDEEKFKLTSGSDPVAAKKTLLDEISETYVEKERRSEIRIFVSSTFKDMQNERMVLAKDVFPALKKLCFERNVFFSYVDLRWGITEQVWKIPCNWQQTVTFYFLSFCRNQKTEELCPSA
jgi:hypothetical protein